MSIHDLPPPRRLRMNSTSRLQEEKQIQVDPNSVALRGSHQYPVVTAPNIEIMSVPPKPSSYSLPSSTTSSPRLIFSKHNKTKTCSKNHDPPPLPPQVSRKYSIALTNLERLREIHLRKSKSCGDGRASRPSVDFEIWSITRANSHNKDEENNEPGIREEHYGSSSGEKFKCGACLFLPGFGGKARAIKAKNEIEPETKLVAISHQDQVNNISIISQRVSLERFECGSWRSSGDGADTTSSKLFFDLPVELIRSASVSNDTNSPVTTGFIFDNYQQQQQQQNRKGVLKNNKIMGSRGGKSHELDSLTCADSSCRQVRFSTSSSPLTCQVSPSSTASCSAFKANGMVRVDNNDLNAFLEAQSG